MYITPLDFSSVLNRFYEERRFDFMLLFVSSFDNKDKAIINKIIENAHRIDRITGRRICFFYFIQDAYDNMNKRLVRWTRNIPNFESIIGEGVSVTMDTADDICQQFGLLRSHLPAFLLIPKDQRQEPQLFSIQDYEDFEDLLTPLNIVLSYIEDRSALITQYEKEGPEGTINLNEELEKTKSDDANKLNSALNSHEGEQLIALADNPNDYSRLVLRIWDLVRSRDVRISRIIKGIRNKISEQGFDVFISCKSQDYAQAHELYDYLSENGFRPFLADTSIKEVGDAHYTHVIGEVLDVCQNMIVFTTNISYLETNYVLQEWNHFVNDINTGHKPYATIINVLSPDIDIHDLPFWLRDKQCFTTDNYKTDLIHFIKINDRFIYDSIRKINDVYYKITTALRDYLYDYPESEYQINSYCERIRKEKLEFEHKAKSDLAYSQYLYGIAIDIQKNWEYEFQQLINEIERLGRQNRWHKTNEETVWHEILEIGTEDAFREYLAHFPKGFHTNEAIEQLNLISDKTNQWLSEIRYSITGESASFPPSYFPKSISYDRPKEQYLYSSFWDKIFGRKTYQTYCSIFAPSEVKFYSHMLIQVYLHLLKETEKVTSLAQESQKDAERRDYIPLQCRLKKGDRVDVQLNIFGETLLMSDKKSIVWQGSFSKCSFDYFVPLSIDVSELSCMALLTVNGIPVGEMRFVTKIVKSPRALNTEIIAHEYSKVFISYSHLDESNVKFLHKGLELAGVEHFYDRTYLKAGDVFPQIIQDYINSADLFILCWSENAARSEYVQKERSLALKRAYPQVQPAQVAKLSMYPIKIEPCAELPSDMKDNYHFINL